MARTADAGAWPATVAAAAVAGMRRLGARPGTCRAVAVALACGVGCAAPDPELPFVVVPVSAQLQLAAADDGPARQLLIRVTVRSLEGGPVEVRGLRVDAETPDEASLLDLQLAWTDFRGDAPACTGRTEQFLLPFVSSGHARADAPLVVERSVDLPPAAPGTLARRITARSRLIGIDLRQEHGRSGGTLLSMADTTLHSFVDAPPGTLAQHLQSRSVPGIFLAAASAPAEHREQTLATLIEALPAMPEPARGAMFAALLYLTGETHGRDIYRWSSWWKARAAATGRRVAPPTDPGP